MKKISYILLSVVFVLVIAGCSNNQKNANIKTEKQTESQKQTEAEKESVTNAVKEAATEATSEAVTEASTEVTNPKEDSDSEHAVEKKSDNAQKAETNENLPKEKEAAKQSDKNAESQNEGKEPAPQHNSSNGNESDVNKQDNSNNGEDTNKVADTPPSIVSYDPNAVVSLATAKCQAGGMITTQQNLQNALSEGRITQEEYPYDGMESSYYSVFVETDLNKAGTVSGRSLPSVEAIAQYIADMLLLEDDPLFYISYDGITTTGGTDFYEFRCHR